MRTLRRFRGPIAIVYWLFVLYVYVGLRYADRGQAEGGIPLVVVCLPWSIPVLFVGSIALIIPGLDHIVPLEAANFIMFVVICGGLNAALILGRSRVVAWFQSSVYKSLALAAAVAAVTLAVQLIMPVVDRDALERSRPQNVLKDAVYVGPAVGWWEHCAYLPAQRIDQCRIWNYRGGILEEGEFVPYDQGAPATSDQLRIVDGGSGPDRIVLRNGRTLIPKSREVQMRRFLDWQNGKRQTP
ncbi:MAG: hypothetical protein ABI693_10795 [Bryobacteraceae bacterium]